MTKSRRLVLRYSVSFKQQVVKELENGEAASSLKKRYGIRGAETISNWVRKFGKNHLLNKIIRIETMEEKDQLKKLREEVRKLKEALADSLMAQRCLETVIEEANKEYKTDLKKSFGSDQSSDLAESSQ